MPLRNHFHNTARARNVTRTRRNMPTIYSNQVPPAVTLAVAGKYFPRNMPPNVPWNYSPPFVFNRIQIWVDLWDQVFLGGNWGWCLWLDFSMEAYAIVLFTSPAVREGNSIVYGKRCDWVLWMENEVGGKIRLVFNSFLEINCFIVVKIYDMWFKKIHNFIWFVGKHFLNV